MPSERPIRFAKHFVSPKIARNRPGKDFFSSLLDAKSRELKRELFELSCDIQRDVTTVDFEQLGSVMLRLRKAQAERSTLLQSLVAALNSQESEQADSESEGSKSS